MAKDNSGRESEYKRIDKMRQGTQDAADGALAELRQDNYGKYKDVKSVLNNGEPWVENEPMNIDTHNADMQARADKAMSDWAKSNPDLYASFVNSQRRPYENGRFGFEGGSGNLNAHGAPYVWPMGGYPWRGSGEHISDNAGRTSRPYAVSNREHTKILDYPQGNQVYNYNYFTDRGMTRTPSSIPEAKDMFYNYPSVWPQDYRGDIWQKPERVETPSYLNTDLNATGPVQGPERYGTYTSKHPLANEQAERRASDNYSRNYMNYEDLWEAGEENAANELMNNTIKATDRDTAVRAANRRARMENGVAMEPRIDHEIYRGVSGPVTHEFRYPANVREDYPEQPKYADLPAHRKYREPSTDLQEAYNARRAANNPRFSQGVVDAMNADVAANRGVSRATLDAINNDLATRPELRQAPSRQMPPETASAARTGGENIYRGVQNQPKRTNGPVVNGAAASGAAMEAINLARDNPTAMTVGVAATLSAVLANNLMNSGMEAAAAYDGAQQMLSDAKSKYDELKQSGLADDVASYFSGWGELLDNIAANASTEGMPED